MISSSRDRHQREESPRHHLTMDDPYLSSTPQRVAQVITASANEKEETTAGIVRTLLLYECLSLLSDVCCGGVF